MTGLNRFSAFAAANALAESFIDSFKTETMWARAVTAAVAVLGAAAVVNRHLIADHRARRERGRRP